MRSPPLTVSAWIRRGKAWHSRSTSWDWLILAQQALMRAVHCSRGSFHSALGMEIIRWYRSQLTAVSCKCASYSLPERLEVVAMQSGLVLCRDFTRAVVEPVATISPNHFGRCLASALETNMHGCPDFLHQDLCSRGVLAREVFWQHLRVEFAASQNWRAPDSLRIC